jgi:hypothetical protein
MRVLLIVVLCLVVQGGMCSGDLFKGNQKMPITDPYFNAITFQLIQPPVTSQEILQKAEQGLDVKPYTIPEFPITSAKSYVEEFLRPLYQPPGGVKFLAFPKENNACDVVRAIYQIDNKTIRIAQSLHLFSVHVQGYSFEQGTSDLERATQVAKEILNIHGLLELEQVGNFGGGVYGIRKTPPSGPVDDEWPHWIDVLRWWYQDGNVGFVTLKAMGGPTMEEIGPDVELNRDWF